MFISSTHYVTYCIHVYCGVVYSFQFYLGHPMGIAVFLVSDPPSHTLFTYHRSWLFHSIAGGSSYNFFRFISNLFFICSVPAVYVRRHNTYNTFTRNSFSTAFFFFVGFHCWYIFILCGVFFVWYFKPDSMNQQWRVLVHVWRLANSVLPFLL